MWRFNDNLYRCVPVTCGGSGDGEVVDVPVDEGQLVDDVSAQSSLLQPAATSLVNGVAAFTLKSEHAVALNEVLTQVHLGAVLLEGAAAMRTRTFVVVQTHLRPEQTKHLTDERTNEQQTL